MKTKRTASKPPKINPLDSPQWTSESTRKAGTVTANGSGSPSYSSSKRPGGVGLSVKPGILCCGVGTKIHAVASAEGPNHKKVPVTLKWPGGSRTEAGIVRETYIVTAEDCGTVLTFTGTANGKTRVAKVPVIKIETITDFRVPKNRDRKKLGVCELDDITVTPKIGTVTWELTGGGGDLSENTGYGVTYTAPDRADTAVIKMTMKTTAQETTVPKEHSCSVSFQIVEPYGIAMSKYPGSAHYHVIHWGSAGFCARMHVLPEDVCFANIAVMEGNATLEAWGYFEALNGRVHPLGPWLEVIEGDNEHPSLVDGTDTVRISNDSTDYADGGAIWDIPWEFTSASALNPKQFTVTRMESTSYKNGTVWTTKGGYSATSAEGDLTSGLECPPAP